jgi:hypothetical protein
MSFTIGAAEEHEPAAAEISGLRMDNRQRESSSHSGINRIASSVEHLYSGARGQFVNAGDDGVRRVSWAQWRSGGSGD